MGFPAGSAGKDSACNAGDWEGPLEKGKATHSSILTWRIPWTVGVTKSGTRLSNFHFHLEELEIPLRTDIGPEDERQFSGEKEHTHEHFR